MWGFAGPLRQIFRSWNFTNVVTLVCVALYVATLVFDPASALRPRGIFDVFAPSNRALWAFGAAGSIPWMAGHWWTVLTAIYLHGGILHIIFNVLWIRQLGPKVEEYFGPARLVIIFTVAGVAGFVVSNTFDVPFTVGASGSIFGLLGALVAYGRRRGGAFGRYELQQYGQWALVLFIAGFFMAGVNNLAHAGGFIGGFVAALLLSLAERRAETTVDWLLAIAAIIATVIGFALALIAAFAR